MARIRRASRTRVPSSVLAALLLLAASCSSDGEPESIQSTQTASSPPTTVAAVSTTSTTVAQTTTTVSPCPPPGGEVVIAEVAEPPTLNPFVPGGDSTILSRIGQGFQRGPWTLDGQSLELVPDLLTEVPTVENGGVVVNEDGTMAVTFRIDERAVWSDGVPVSGEDFVFTVETILNPDHPTSKELYEAIVDTDSTSNSFTLTMVAPTIRYETLFSQGIIPAHAVRGSDFIADWNDVTWPSSGPFVLDEWTIGESIRLVRNDEYWKNDPECGELPYLDEVVFQFMSPAEGFEAFRNREVDVLALPFSNETFAAMTALESGGARVHVRSGFTWEHLDFQFGIENRNELSANALHAFRRCVAHAVDRHEIVDQLFDGHAEALDSFVDVYLPSLSTAAWAQYDYDPANAEALCDDARAELGLEELRVVFSTNENLDLRFELAALLEEMFEAVGVDYVAELEASDTFFGTTLFDGSFDLGAWAWNARPGLSGLASVMSVWDPASPPPEGSNFVRWGAQESTLIDEHSERFSEILEGLGTVDERELRVLINEAESLLADQVIVVPLYARPLLAVTWADEISGYVQNPSHKTDTWNIEEWHRVR